MNQTLKKEVRLEWITQAPTVSNKVAMLIPQYNESSNMNMLNRLRYFQNLALCMNSEIDVIIIDDGSTDDSLEVIRSFLVEEECKFYVASVFPNTNKVGALYVTTLKLDHDVIILSDFDTDLKDYECLPTELMLLAKDEEFMGGYFRMLPFEGKGNIFLFQQIEYSLARSLYKFHHKDNSVPVMPGAGSCYKRDVLVKIFQQHSGLRSGEDRESTLIGLRLGYGTKYLKGILTLTRPPLTFTALVKQRIRWNLGYIETFAKEKQFYFEQARTLTRLGQRSIGDLGTVFLLMLLPLALCCALFFSVTFFIKTIAITYSLYFLWCTALVISAPNESDEFRKARYLSIFIYPFLKVVVDYVSWLGAFIEFYRKNRRQNAYYNHFVLKHLITKDEVFLSGPGEVPRSPEYSKEAKVLLN